VHCFFDRLAHGFSFFCVFHFGFDFFASSSSSSFCASVTRPCGIQEPTISRQKKKEAEEKRKNKKKWEKNVIFFTFTLPFIIHEAAPFCDVSAQKKERKKDEKREREGERKKKSFIISSTRKRKNKNKKISSIRIIPYRHHHPTPSNTLSIPLSPTTTTTTTTPLNAQIPHMHHQQGQCKTSPHIIPDNAKIK
jgi:hypothetical protein